MALQRLVVTRWAIAKRLVNRSLPSDQTRQISNTSSLSVKPNLKLPTKRWFSFMPGKGDCTKTKETSMCKKKDVCKSDEGCAHPPPSCASICKSCPSEKKPSCPLPQRPPQPAHCLINEVKHKPGHCPGPCKTSGC